MENNVMAYISSAFRAVEIMRTNVGMKHDYEFAAVFPQHAVSMMKETHSRLLRQISIAPLSDIGGENGFRHRICGSEFHGLFIHHAAKLTRYELEYLLTRLRHAREGTVFMDEFHQGIALDILISRAEESEFKWANENAQKIADICGVGDKYKQIVTDMMWDFR